jgi:hypothetical protein
MSALSFEKQQVIAEEKELFFKELGTSKSIGRKRLKTIADVIDEKISSAIKVAVMKRHQFVFKDDSRYVSNSVISSNNQEYFISIDAQDNLLEKKFRINFVTHTQSSSPPEMIAISKAISEKGKFKLVEIFYPKGVLKIDETFIFALSVSLFNMGYDWLNITLLRTIKEITKDLNVEIYDFMHRMILDHKLLEGFLFSVVTKDRAKKEKDFVLLDERATETLVDLAEKSDYLTGEAPARLVSDMVFEVVPVEESVIADVIANNSKVDINLKKTDRWNTNNLAGTLRAVWGDMVCCYPITKEGTFYLVAFYPKKNDEYIETYLKLHRDAIDELAKKNILNIHKTLKLLDTINGEENALFGAELFGAFLSQYLG